MLRAGRLRDRIKVRRFEATDTGKGGQTHEWRTLLGMSRVPAEIVGQSGRESVIANTLQGVATYRITIRHREGIQANDQIIWLTGGNQELNILAPPSDPVGDRKFLQILADTSSPQNAGN